ncbi:hypothetical protein ACQ4PT_028064 [Festuca glaucescens]
MEAEPCSERAEGDMSKDSVKRDKKKKKEGKKKKKEEEAKTKGQKQTFDTTAENLVAERGEVEGKQSSKSKKSKRKRSNAGVASACDKVVTREDKKRKKKHTVVLEKRSKPKNTSKGEHGEIKERVKESNESSPKFSENASAGREEADVDGKNEKKKKKSKEGTQEGMKEKEKAARSKNKGKRVNFADSAEVFRTEVGDSEGIKGGIKKRKKASQSKNKGKRVSFANSAEVFRIEGRDNEEGGSTDESKFVHGQRFSPEEDAILMEAIRDFTEMKQLGEKGLEMILFPRKHKELRRCWDVIGSWAQDEYQKLFDLVNLDLRMKAHQNKNPDNRKLRDNMSWEAISDKLTTRNHKNCCLKWYDTLASPMVRKGIWADVDDYLLVEASREVCRQRWNQMVRGLGSHREKPFIEQVDVLSRRYCSEMIEYRKLEE